MSSIASLSISLRRAFALGAAASILAQAPPARAGAASAEDAARAEQLFQQAKALMAAKNYAEACPKLAESQRLDPGTGTLLALAMCHEAQGSFTMAWSEFRKAIPAARAERRSDRVAVATNHLSRLEPKVARLVVHVSRAGDATGLTLRRDGETLGADAIDSATAVDIGTHTIIVTAPGREPWRGRVAVEQEGKLYEVTVPPLAEMASAPAAAAPAPEAATASSAEESTPPPQETPTLRWVAYGLVGVGVAGLAMGSVAGSIAIFDATKANTTCPTTACTSTQAIQTNDEARASATISNVAFGVGIAALGVGTALWLLTPATQAGSIHAAASPSGAFISYDRRF